MSKKLLAFAIGSLLLLIFGTELIPDNPVFWLASSAMGYQAVRFGLLLVLMLQFATDPPRHRTFRMMSGFVAITTALWALQSTYGNSMMFLDTLSFLSASIAIGLIALERNVEPVKNSQKAAA